jgi:hypothetical protein
MKVVVRHTLLEALASGWELTQIKQGSSQDIISLHKGYWVIFSLGQRKVFFPQVTSLSELQTAMIHRPQSSHHSEGLGTLALLLAQRLGPYIRLLDLWGSVSTRDVQRRAESQKEREFLLDTLRGLGERVKQLQASGEVADGFLMGTPLLRVLPGVSQILYRSLRVSSAPKMLRQFGGQLPRTHAIARLQPPSNLSMPPRPPARWYPLIQRLAI